MSAPSGFITQLNTNLDHTAPIGSATISVSTPLSVSKSRSGLSAIVAPSGRSEPGLALDQVLDASSFNKAAGIHGDAAQDGCVRHGQQRFRVAHAILQCDKSRIANERRTQLL